MLHSAFIIQRWSIDNYKSSCRRSVHVSVYDKNPEEQSRPSLVPDHVISAQPEHYWSPHPQTGVFGPAKDHKPDRGFHVSVAAESVLEQKAFFRPLENLEKPIHHWENWSS